MLGRGNGTLTSLYIHTDEDLGILQKYTLPSSLLNIFVLVRRISEESQTRQQRS